MSAWRSVGHLLAEAEWMVEHCCHLRREGSPLYHCGDHDRAAETLAALLTDAAHAMLARAAQMRPRPAPAEGDAPALPPVPAHEGKAAGRISESVHG